jgi:DNA-directed RNA polymerase specialized sigma24 family protein
VEPDKALSKSEKVATVEEIRQAVEKLTKSEWAKLHSFARNRARMMALRGSAFTEEDLVREAILALLEERRTWNPKKVDFVGLLIGAIRSIASNYKAATEDGDFALPASQIVSPEEDEDEPSSPTEMFPDGRPTPEQAAVVSNLLSEVHESFSDDAEALVIMDGWRDRMSGTEIIEALEIDRSTYETIARRIRRKTAARWPKGSHNVRK